MLYDLTQFCLRNSFFQFDNLFYKQVDGTAMGMALAPFISSDIFLGHFEECFSSEDWFPKIWWRYVDDIFVILKQNQVDLVLSKLNSTNMNIEFTHEVEMNNCLPFLDILIQRNNNKLDFSVYRKPTSTKRFIPSSSHHCFQQKMSAFNSMVHRMLHLPLSAESRRKEQTEILEIAKINGYHEDLIYKIINRQMKKLTLRNISTLSIQQNDQNLKYIKIPYNPPLCYKLTNALKQINKRPVFSSSYKIQQMLCNNKDKKEPLLNSGIYSIKCSTCEMVYIGQSRRAVNIRWKEHNAHIAKNEAEKSSVASHFLEHLDHVLEKSNFKIEKIVSEPSKLDITEALFMRKYQNSLMNSKPPNCDSILLNLLS